MSPRARIRAGRGQTRCVGSPNVPPDPSRRQGPTRRLCVLRGVSVGLALTERNTAPVRRGPPGRGPVHSLAETPDGAWAEFIRHEQCAEAPTEVMVRVRTRCEPV